jgi:hypothetical protein
MIILSQKDSVVEAVFHRDVENEKKKESLMVIRGGICRERSY